MEIIHGPIRFQKIHSLPRGAMLKVDNHIAQNFILEAPGSIYESEDGGDRYLNCPTPAQVGFIGDPAASPGPLTIPAGTWLIDRWVDKQ